MFNKRVWNKIKIYLGLFICSVAIIFSPTATISTYASEATNVEVRTDYREWRYKIEDGKLYKRLYNASTGLWETDWIYVCEWPEGAA